MEQSAPAGRYLVMSLRTVIVIKDQFSSAICCVYSANCSVMSWWRPVSKLTRAIKSQTCCYSSLLVETSRHCEMTTLFSTQDGAYVHHHICDPAAGRSDGAAEAQAQEGAASSG